LAGNADGTGGGLVRGCLPLADCGAKRVHQALPQAIVAPLREVFIDWALGQEIVWKQVLLAACAVEVKYGVDDFSHMPCPLGMLTRRGWSR
jgi:hypothetical protein